MIREIVIQLLYGTAILTTIIVAPLVTLQTQLVSRERPTASFLYPGIVVTAIVSLMLTILAMSPYLMLPSRLLAKHPKKVFLAIMPWVLVCVIKFALNVKLQLRAISHVATGSNSNSLVFALGSYCGIFGLAVEQMLHWSVIYHLMTEGVETTVSNFRWPRRIY
ncbi:uncharacterized protein LOC119555420 [Drosophila subpulchrella]|uniref:uncharacterized protein LOC119555420 n=1 Tax=Drosophila subpulchrella TaxID=1486046 RepID=UPI0018A14F46|nr:uncharacterized protein LOC119555420 [Drosophila subpulchrella]